MTRLLLLSLAMLGCGRQALPGWSEPLVRSPHEALPARPMPASVPPPSLPSVTMPLVAPGAPRLALVDVPGSLVRISVVTRRGEDDAWPMGTVELTTELLAMDLSRHVAEAVVGSGTDVHGSHLSIVVPRDRLGLALRTLARVLSAPEIEADDVRVMREARVVRLERTTQSSRAVAWIHGIDHLHDDVDSIDQALTNRLRAARGLTLETVHACRAERFAPADMVVVVAGDVSATEVGAEYERAFGDWTASPPRRNRPPRRRDGPRRAVISVPMRTRQAHVLFLRRAPHPAHPTRQAYQLLVESLGGSFVSRLNGSLRETHAYTYGAFAFISATEHSDILAIESSFTSDRVGDAVAHLFEQLRQLRTRPPSQPELDAARTRLWSNVARRSEGLNGVDLVIEAWTAGLTVAELQRRYAALENLTPELASRVAQRFFHPLEGLFVLTGDFSRIGGLTVERLEDGFHLRR